MNLHTQKLSAVIEREFRTVTRTRAYILTLLTFVAVLVGLALVGGISGYISVVLNILLPLELLLPVLAAAFGYRSLIADRESGELEMLRTFPISRLTYISGILIGRLTVLLLVVLGTFLVIGISVPLLTPESSQFLQRQTTYNGPLLFIRFGVLTALATTVLFAIMMALSAVSRNSSRGLALVVLGGVGLAIGLDLAIVVGFAVELFPQGWLPWVLATSPLSAFRTLVLGTVIEPAVESQMRTGSVVGSLVSLFLWLSGALIVAVSFVWEPTEN
jgi:ABC-2 type transport system permease protein